MKITITRLFSLLFSLFLGASALAQGYPGYGDDRAEIENRVIKVDGDKAGAFTYWFQVNNNGADRSANYGFFGHYEDELAKADCQWLFTHRSIFNEGIKTRSRAGYPNPAH